MNGLVEEADHVLCATFAEYVAGCDVPAVVVEDGYEPIWGYEFQVALPEAVGVCSLPTLVSSFDSGLG